MFFDNPCPLNGGRGVEVHPPKSGCGSFAYSWRLSAYNVAFLLTIVFGSFAAHILGGPNFIHPPPPPDNTLLRARSV